ncbi:CdaR family protein [Paenibacillus sp. IHBB 10380]|uniref:CdaR family protein n=1 Tax=Paenibacillus sp. IHBB 10380 TaxID=1566358 RepID=UPI0006975708|nr:CdaR family protein [Paenibacillus sp. IHBB 10380]
MDRWLKNNNVVKILAIALSILLWAIVHLDNSTPTPTTTIDSKVIENIKVQAFDLDDSKYVLSAMDKDNVRMEVRGRRSDITSLFNEDYRVRLDLSDVKEGTNTLPLSYDLPFGVELVSMQPKVVTVIIERRETASYPVNIVTKGRLADGYKAEAAVIDPSTVKVTLPSTSLADVVKIEGTVEFDGHTETFTQKKVKLTAYNNKGQEMKDAIIEPSSVSVEIPVIAPSINVPISIQYTGSLPEGLVLSEVTPNISQVKLYGPQDKLVGMNSYNDVMVDLSLVKQSGKSALSIDLKPPAGLVRIEPSTIQVEVDAVSVGERTVDGIPITIEGMDSGIEATIISPADKSVTMKLTGAASLLNSLNKEDIKIVAHVQGLKSGSHEVKLEVTLPRFITAADKQPLTATIEIKDKTIPSTAEPEPAKPDKENGSDSEPDAGNEVIGPDIEGGDMGEATDPNPGNGSNVTPPPDGEVTDGTDNTEP